MLPARGMLPSGVEVSVEAHFAARVYALLGMLLTQTSLAALHPAVVARVAAKTAMAVLASVSSHVSGVGFTLSSHAMATLRPYGALDRVEVTAILNTGSGSTDLFCFLHSVG